MNTAVARLNWEGQVVDGKFPLQKWLGGSERCDVFRTQLPGQPPQTAAIKLVSPEAGNAEQQVTRWQMAATLTHPNLLRVFHAGRCSIGNTPLVYVVMEYAEEDLSQVLPARALSVEEVRQMLPPLLDALSYLHSRGLVHGRVKPSNIMAIADQLKLSVDSIRAVGESADQTLPRSAFDAPEVARAGGSRPADVWALGVTLVRCLGPRPQIRENYNPIEQGIAQTIPEPFRHIARECLRPDPKARCTLSDIREQMRPAVAAPAAVQDAGRRARPSLAVIASIAVVFLLAVVFVVRWATHSKSETPARTAPAHTATEPAPLQPSASASASAPAGIPPQHAVNGAVIERVMPDVAVSARHTIQGKIRVSVRVAVSPAGEVTEASLASPGPSKYFANKALDASRHWKFKPGESNGQPAPSEWILRYQFTQNATDVVPEELPAATR